MDHQQYNAIKESALKGRYITPRMIEPLFESDHFETKRIGTSVNGRPIFAIAIGSGPRKVLMWSQMHGNESTTTKAVFDLLNFLKSESAILQNLSIAIVPMLNPDGAVLYTRENASGIDLNRDFCDLSQPESRALMDFADGFSPDFCFNLHDQRTIFGVGNSGLSTCIAFLAPSFNESREINDVRASAMNVIAKMNDELQKIIPGRVARFDDGFNLNCVGDTFQHKGIPTILFEAGHYPGDYQREETRKFIFISMLTALRAISENDVAPERISDYLNISQNTNSFYDIVCKNVNFNYDSVEIITNFAIQFVEIPENGVIIFKGYIAETGHLLQKFGHLEIDAGGALFSNALNRFPEPGDIADFWLGDRKFSGGVEVQK